MNYPELFSNLNKALYEVYKDKECGGKKPGRKSVPDFYKEYILSICRQRAGMEDLDTYKQRTDKIDDKTFRNAMSKIPDGVKKKGKTGEVDKLLGDVFQQYDCIYDHFDWLFGESDCFKDPAAALDLFLYKIGGMETDFVHELFQKTDTSTYENGVSLIARIYYEAVNGRPPTGGLSPLKIISTNDLNAKEKLSDYYEHSVQQFLSDKNLVYLYGENSSAESFAKSYIKYHSDGAEIPTRYSRTCICTFTDSLEETFASLYMTGRLKTPATEESAGEVIRFLRTPQSDLVVLITGYVMNNNSEAIERSRRDFEMLEKIGCDVIVTGDIPTDSSPFKRLSLEIKENLRIPPPLERSVKRAMPAETDEVGIFDWIRSHVSDDSKDGTLLKKMLDNQSVLISNNHFGLNCSNDERIILTNLAFISPISEKLFVEYVKKLLDYPDIIENTIDGLKESTRNSRGWISVSQDEDCQLLALANKWVKDILLEAPDAVNYVCIELIEELIERTVFSYTETFDERKRYEQTLVNLFAQINDHLNNVKAYAPLKIQLLDNIIKIKDYQHDEKTRYYSKKYFEIISDYINDSSLDSLFGLLELAISISSVCYCHMHYLPDELEKRTVDLAKVHYFLNFSRLLCDKKEAEQDLKEQNNALSKVYSVMGAYYQLMKHFDSALVSHEKSWKHYVASLSDPEEVPQINRAVHEVILATDYYYLSLDESLSLDEKIENAKKSIAHHDEAIRIYEQEHHVETDPVKVLESYNKRAGSLLRFLILSAENERYPVDITNLNRCICDLNYAAELLDNHAYTEYEREKFYKTAIILGEFVSNHITPDQFPDMKYDNYMVLIMKCDGCINREC